MGSTEHLNGREFQGRAIIADGRNATQPLRVRDLNPTVSGKHSSSSKSSTAAASAASATPESPSYATGGPVYRPDPSLILSSPTSTTSSSFSQVGPSSHTSSSPSKSIPRDQQARQYQCLMSIPTARELMPHFFSQGGEGYNISLPPSSFMACADVSFPHAVMPGYDSLPTGFSQPSPLSMYGFGPCHNPIQGPHLFMNYPTSEGSQAIYSSPTSYAVQPPYHTEYYPRSATAITNQMANMAIGGGPIGGVVYTEQRGIHLRDISRRASEEQIRRMIRDATGPEVNLINLVEVPLDKDRNPRGWASVHFHSADLARRMVERLHGYDFKGRKLQVRLMKEGEAINGSSGTAAAAGSRQHRSGKHQSSRKDESRRTERKERERGDKTSSNNSASKTCTPSSSSKSTPLVVGGNLTAKSTISSSKEKDKHGKRSSTVVIVDGSSGRRKGDGG